MKECPHCHHPLTGEIRCPNCGADMVAAEPGGPVPLETRSLLLWAAVFAPGIACLLTGLVTTTWWLAGVGAVLVLVPLLVQLFGADWGTATQD